MIQKSTFTFLTDLSQNNNREWFQENKGRFEAAKTDFLEFTTKLLVEMAKIQPDLNNTLAKDCIFRIYKDVRFSKDKSPYKNHFSAAFGPGGKKSNKIDFYFQLQPDGQSMLGGGMWQPTPEQLAAFRQEIDYNPSSIKDIIFKEPFKSNFPHIYGEKLKKAPKGYSPDHEDVELLKYKEMFFYKNYDDEDLFSENAISLFMKDAVILKPFLDYSNEILGK
jgi:uncharacterized protein (TIGR02453 family)